jgi:hypothetical protein
VAVHAGRALFEQGIGDRRGNAQRGVLVWVYDRGTSTLSTLYTDRTKATVQDNPLSTNGLGNLSIFADPGDYEAHVDSTGAVLEFTVLPDWEDGVSLSGGTLTGPLRVPGGVYSAPGLQVGSADTGIYEMPDGELGFVVDGALIFHTSESAGTGIRRDMGNPFIGGRVYVEDELFVEDDLWGDEGIQVSSANLPVLTTTLAAAADAGDNTIVVASVPGSWVVDKTIHLIKTVGSQYDRPRIRDIDGTTITLESALQYAYPLGTTVAENPWRGAVFPTTAWPMPSGVMYLGANRTAAEAAAAITQIVLLDAEHCRYRHGLAELFSADWIVSGGATSAAGGMSLAVSAAVFALAGDVVRATAQTVTVPTAHATLPRIDIVVYSADGVASVVAGIAAGSPVAPTPSASQFLLAEVAVAAATASIAGGDITSRLARAFRFNTADPSNAGWVFGTADGTGVRTRTYAGALHIVEGLDAGAFSSLDLNPSGGQVTVGAGGLVSAGNIETSDVGDGFVLKSPDGTRYRLAVANGGALSAVAI